MDGAYPHPNPEPHPHPERIEERRRLVLRRLRTMRGIIAGLITSLSGTHHPEPIALELAGDLTDEYFELEFRPPAIAAQDDDAPLHWRWN